MTSTANILTGPGRPLNLIGQQFGRLTVTSLLGRKSTYRLWGCSCVCGELTEATTNQLRMGHVKSCGCLVVEQCRSLRKQNLKPPGASAFNWLLDVYRRSAQERNYEFSISEADFRRLTSLDCSYCGSPPSRLKKVKSGNGHYVYNGLDRVDNSKGYTLDNVVTCCKTCNRAKDQMSVSEFQAWVLRVCSRINIKN